MQNKNRKIPLDRNQQMLCEWGTGSLGPTDEAMDDGTVL